MHRRLNNYLGMTVIITLTLFTLSTYALDKDSSEKIHITADTSSSNYKKRENTFEGHVKITQGSTYLTAERVTTQTNAQHKIETAIAYGIHTLAEYSTLPKEGDDRLFASARTITFYPLKHLVTLEGDVSVIQGENSFHGPVLFYNTDTQIITSPAGVRGQATIMIQPKKLNA